VQTLRNFSTFYEPRRFITVFTRALNWSLSWARSVQSISPYNASKLNPWSNFGIKGWNVVLLIMSIFVTAQHFCRIIIFLFPPSLSLTFRRFRQFPVLLFFILTVVTQVCYGSRYGRQFKVPSFLLSAFNDNNTNGNSGKQIISAMCVRHV
jgi:hypothetical protein